MICSFAVGAATHFLDVDARKLPFNEKVCCDQRFADAVDLGDLTSVRDSRHNLVATLRYLVDFVALGTVPKSFR